MAQKLTVQAGQPFTIGPQQGWYWQPGERLVVEASGRSQTVIQLPATGSKEWSQLVAEARQRSPGLFLPPAVSFPAPGWQAVPTPNTYLADQMRCDEQYYTCNRICRFQMILDEADRAKQQVCLAQCDADQAHCRNYFCPRLLGKGFCPVDYRLSTLMSGKYTAA